MYIVYGIDKTDKNIINNPILKSDAEKGFKKSFIQISKYMLQKSI
jgi:hypothetical protein